VGKFPLVSLMQVLKHSSDFNLEEYSSSVRHIVLNVIVAAVLIGLPFH
jgi:hypothetical protein